MAEPTLIEVFGAGATQTATTITIQKSSLTGLTATATNTAESLFAGIYSKASTALSQANYSTNIDQSIVIVPGYDSVVYRTVNNVQTAFLQTQMTTSFSKAQTSAGITPDSY